jgi:hypothetical protein
MEDILRTSCLDMSTIASVQRCLGSCGYSDRHHQCGGEVPLHCQQVLHTRGFLDVPTSKNPEESSLASMQATEWVLLYLSIGHYWCYYEPLTQQG